MLCFKSDSPSFQEGVVQHLQSQGQACELMRSIYLQELNRVKYLMRAYLRCRLLKIEKYVMFILDNEEEQDKLSPQELNHAQVNAVSSHTVISSTLSELHKVLHNMP